jgi:molecular chaperone GrpE
MVKEKKDKHQEKIDQLEAQVKELENARLMALADFENYKKRVQKEREEFSLLANAGVLNILLDVLDDVKRASENNPNKEGLEMIISKVEGILNEQNLERVEVSVNDIFDPKKMEAIGTVAVNDDKQNNRVIHVERAGYKFKDNDMFVRGCRVIVGKFPQTK